MSKLRAVVNIVAPRHGFTSMHQSARCLPAEDDGHHCKECQRPANLEEIKGLRMSASVRQEIAAHVVVQIAKDLLNKAPFLFGQLSESAGEPTHPADLCDGGVRRF